MENKIESLENKLIQQHTEYNYMVMENYKKMKKMKKRMEKMEEMLYKLVTK
jgi:uncharacterized coiled-coil protein SlyX